MDDSLNDHLTDLDPDYNYFENHISENHTFSSFDSMDDFLTSNPTSLNDSNFISIYSQNIRSFNRNLDNFLTMFFEDAMPDVFIFSEVLHVNSTPVNIHDVGVDPPLFCRSGNLPRASIEQAFQKPSPLNVLPFKGLL